MWTIQGMNPVCYACIGYFYQTKNIFQLNCIQKTRFSEIELLYYDQNFFLKYQHQLLFLPSIIYQIVLLCHFEYKKICGQRMFSFQIILTFQSWSVWNSHSSQQLSSCLGSSSQGLRVDQLTKQPSFSHLFIFSRRRDPPQSKPHLKFNLEKKSFFLLTQSLSIKHHFLPHSQPNYLSVIF